MLNYFVSDQNSTDYSVVLESVLCGHENWVYSVRWHPPQFSGNSGLVLVELCHQYITDVEYF